MIYKSIENNFKHLELIVRQCNELKAAKDTYYQAYNEQHLDIDRVSKNQTQYDEKAQDAQDAVNDIEKDIGQYFCDGYNTLEPLAIGLFGEWGSGKTHLLKGVKNKILNTHEEDIKLWEKNSNDKNLVIPIFFNAWRFEKDKHIIVPLFQTIITELEKYKDSSKIDNIKNYLKVLTISLVKNFKISDIEDIGKLFTGNVTVLKNFFNWKSVISDTKKKDRSEELDTLLTSGRIESVYLNIPHWIEKITIFEDIRFVFLIDDLDRCLPENSLKMLESMKLFLDVPGCSFVLAVDDDVVERGVEHHYKDYILDAKGKNKNILPITGAEYLEKMVQLPFRIPPINALDIEEFLAQRYSRFDLKNLDDTDIRDELKSNEKSLRSTDKELLEFFSQNIPPKPRKIIRTINLYESKEFLMKGMDINHKLLAVLTLLELFTPKLLRFMQTKGYSRIYNRLVQWNKEYKSLNETENITEKSINRFDEQSDKDTFKALVEILKEIHQSRIEFNLDAMFKEPFSEEIINMHTFFKVPIKKDVSIKTVTQPEDKEAFFNRLFSEDALLWLDAFNEDKRLKDNNVILDSGTFEDLLQQEKLSSKVKNPQWLEMISQHLSDEDFMKLVEAHNPFEEH
jgi:hypothetical protein